VNAEYFFSFVQVGQVYMYLTVETSCTQQRLVEHIHTVGGCEDDDTAVGAESVHLGEQLVQCVFSFVVAAHGGILAAGTAHGIYFVDEDDARSFLFRLFEQVAYT
jgi:thiamine phosphate synthase YjbQ (UPF0047 family)